MRTKMLLGLLPMVAGLALLASCSDASADSSGAARLRFLRDGARPVFSVDEHNNLIVAPGMEMEALRACVGILEQPPIVESIPWHDDKCLTFDRRHPAVIGKCGEGPYDSPDAIKRFAEQQRRSEELFGLGPVGRR